MIKPFQFGLKLLIMLSPYHFKRFFAKGMAAFPNEAEFKSKVADTFYDLADFFSSKYEKLGDSFIIDAQDDSLSFHTTKHDILCSRQSPNRQIWVSSPVSGSLKFEYDSDSNKWVDTKDDKLDLNQSLINEVEKTLKVD